MLVDFSFLYRCMIMSIIGAACVLVLLVGASVALSVLPVEGSLTCPLAAIEQSAVLRASNTEPCAWIVDGAVSKACGNATAVTCSVGVDQCDFGHVCADVLYSSVDSSSGGRTVRVCLGACRAMTPPANDAVCSEQVNDEAMPAPDDGEGSFPAVCLPVVQTCDVKYYCHDTFDDSTASGGGRWCVGVCKNAGEAPIATITGTHHHH